MTDEPVAAPWTKKDFEEVVKRQVRVIAGLRDQLRAATTERDAALVRLMEAQTASGVAALQQQLATVTAERDAAQFRCHAWEAASDYDYPGEVLLELGKARQRATQAEQQLAKARGEATALRELMLRGAWLRDEDGRTQLAVRMADGTDLSCRLTRDDAITAAIAALPPPPPRKEDA